MKVYAGRIKNIDEYKSSTSGGIATALSQYVIEQGGIVYGAACMEEIDIRHIRIEKKRRFTALKKALNTSKVASTTHIKTY